MLNKLSLAKQGNKLAVQVERYYYYIMDKLQVRMRKGDSKSRIFLRLIKLIKVVFTLRIR